MDADFPVFVREIRVHPCPIWPRRFEATLRQTLTCPSIVLACDRPTIVRLATLMALSVARVRQVGYNRAREKLLPHTSVGWFDEPIERWVDP